MEIDDERLSPFRAIGRGRAAAEQVADARAAVAGERPLADPVGGRVLLAGDWHGNTAHALTVLRHASRVGARTVLQLGDFGISDEGEGYLDVLSAAAERLSLTLLVVDGNHENFPLLYRFPVLEQEGCPGLRALRPHVWHLPRGTRWTWSWPDGTGHRWLAVGGAASVDRALRREGVSWWPQEELTESQASRIAAGGPADVVVCHDRPQAAALAVGEVAGQWWERAPSAWAREDLARSDAHSARLQRVVDAVRPQHVWHGHLHRRSEVRLEPVSWHGVCTVHGLASDGDQVGTSTALAGLDGAEYPDPDAATADRLQRLADAGRIIPAREKGDWSWLRPPRDIPGPSSDELLRKLRGDR